MSVVSLTAEQLQMVEIVHDYAIRFPLGEVGDAQLLQNSYDYMDAFKRVIDSTSKIQLDYISLQYGGFHRFGKLMEMLAQDIIDGKISVPKPD